MFRLQIVENWESGLNLTLDGLKPKIKDHDVLTGDIVTTSTRKLRARANDKVFKAQEMAMRLNGTVVSRRMKLRAATVAIIPQNPQIVMTAAQAFL